jgi:anti-sigma regulatory factor (Ser/Thr protein kinase)
VTDCLNLEPVSSSAAVARQWLSRELADCPDELVEDAALLLSELVTNAVLHAQTQVQVSVGSTGGRVRVEVTDSSPVLPTAKGYGTDAATGRGLQLVEALAERWGIAAVPGGKVVWFEVGQGLGTEDVPDDSSVPPGGEAGEGAEPSDEAAAELVGVELLSLPLPLLRRTSQQYDALLREFRLIAEHEPNSRAVPGRLVALSDELSGRYSSFTVSTDAALAAALERGDASIDLHYRLPVDVGAAAAHYDEMLDEADAWCRAGELLTLAPPLDAVALRKWLLLEFVHQVAGSPAVAWPDSVWAASLR